MQSRFACAAALSAIVLLTGAKPAREAIVVEQQQFVPAKDLEKARAAVLAHFMDHRQEPSVKAAKWWLDWKFVVARAPNGSAQDGFAQYVCTVVTDHGLNKVLVKVIDAQAMLRDQLLEIGEADCTVAP